MTTKATSQTIDVPCGSDHKNDSLFQHDPRFQRSMFLLESVIHQNQQLSPEDRTDEVYTLPVVVHVIHEGEPYGQGSNITDEQIISAITALNEDFRKMPGTNGFGAGVDVGVQFCLASRNPSGQPTTGINRVNGSSVPLYADQGIQSSGGNGANELSVKALSTWPRTSYLNIWVVNEIGNNDGGSGVQGYAYFPVDNPVDGVVILHNAFGTVGNLKSYTNLNRTLTHEVGHYLGLYHTFHDTNSCTESNCTTAGDRVCDTPPTVLNASCSAPACSGTQQVENYLDYTSQTCQDMFTEGQKVRMRTTLESQRTSMLSSLGCMPVYTRDAGITAVISPLGTSCNTSYIPQVTLTNFGSATLTSCTINYNLNGTNNNTFSWTGNLASGASATVTLPTITASIGNYTFYAFTSSPNGQSDENASNNQSTSSFVVTNGATYTLSVNVDYFGAENTWEVRDENNNIMDFGGPYPNNVQGTIFTESLCLPNGCYSLNFFDSYGDGQSFTTGSFSLRDDNNVVLFTRSGNWGPVSNNPFCVTSAPAGSAPTADFTVSDNLICPNSSVSFTYTGQNNPTTYNWIFEGASTAVSTASNPANINYLNPGVYDVTLTVSNEYGSDIYTCNNCITVSSNPSIAFTTNAPSCHAGNNGVITTVVTNGNAPYTYNWVNGPTTANRSNLVAGNYTLNVTDAQGCTAQASAAISQPAPLVISGTVTNTTCAGSANGQINVVATGGTGAINYVWSNGQTGTSVSALAAGPYTVAITDANNCTANQTFTVGTPSPLQVSVFHTDATCHGMSDGSAVASATGGTGNISFVWSTGENSQFISNVPAGAYILTATDANGCTDTESFLIEQPDMLLANAIVLSSETCAGNDGSATISVEGGNGDYIVVWADGSMNSTIENVSAGDYFVSIADGNGCAMNINVNIPYECEVSVPETRLSDADCGTENVSLTSIISCIPVENASMYQWKFATATGAIITEEFTLSNQFMLGQTDAITNNMTLLISVKALVDSNWGAYGQVCSLETEQVLGTTALNDEFCGAVVSSWNAEIVAVSIENAIMYEWEITTPQGVILSSTNTNALVLNESLGIQNNSAYSIRVRAQVDDNLFTEWGMACTITLAIETVGFDELANTLFQIYPNPNDGYQITLQAKGEFALHNIDQIDIFNAAGQLIEKINPNSALGGATKLDIVFKEKLSSGIYFIRYQMGEVNYEDKLIVR